jgi:7-cyano-7-deazaguanine synthase
LSIDGKHLVLLSGGLDSATAAFWVKEQGHDLECLYFDYHQGRKNAERECARWMAKRLGARLTVLETPLPTQSLRRITSCQGTDTALFGDVVNLCVMAIAFAYTCGIHSTIIGVNANDVRVYPALQRGFFRAMERLSRIWLDKRVRMLTPFLEEDKSSIVRIGVGLGVPFEETWSCSVSVDKHCGICPDCVARKQAFKEVGLADPTRYEHNN